jgi:hypothetical protein
VNKPNAAASSCLRVGSTRNRTLRESAHLVTGGPTTGSGSRESGPLRSTSSTGIAVYSATGDLAHLARGGTPDLLREGRARVDGSKKSVSGTQRCGPLRGYVDVKGAGGAECRREGARANRLAGAATCRRRLAAGVTGVRETTVELGRCLTVACGFDRPCTSADPGFMNPGVGGRVSQNVARWLTSRIRTRYRACPAACGAARNRILNRGGASSEGGEAQESTDSAVPPWPGLRNRNRERTPEGSKASKRACRSLTRRAQCRQ